jgi:hypothetical protein
MTTDNKLPIVIAKRYKTSKRIVVLYMPGEAPERDAHWREIRFVPEHDYKYMTMNLRTTSLSSERTGHDNDKVVIPSEWDEEFRGLKLKTVRVMSDEVAARVVAAYQEMQETIEAARRQYQFVINEAWDVARVMRQQDIDPAMRDDDDGGAA